MQGLDAFGLATLDYLTSMANTSIPFAASSSSSMTEEDMMNLRTFRRLMLILSGFQKNGGSPVVRSCAYFVRKSLVHSFSVQGKVINVPKLFFWMWFCEVQPSTINQNFRIQ